MTLLIHPATVADLPAMMALDPAGMAPMCSLDVMPCAVSTVSTSPALIRSLSAFWNARRLVVLETFFE